MIKSANWSGNIQTSPDVTDSEITQGNSSISRVGGMEYHMNEPTSHSPFPSIIIISCSLYPLLSHLSLSSSLFLLFFLLLSCLNSDIIWSLSAIVVFDNLKHLFPFALIIVHVNQAKVFHIEANSSNFAIVRPKFRRWSWFGRQEGNSKARRQKCILIGDQDDKSAEDWL